MRDKADNVIIVCSIENFDPMGVHTGDSITVAPQQTLTNDEYQAMRDEAKRIIRAIGVETGGSNIQFAVHPTTGRRLAIEMNPRVSRSSALASKATGFPIAKFAAKLAAGYTLDEIPNDITRKTPASFEPSIDYVVVKIPRFAFEKFRNTPPVLGLVDAVGRRGDGHRPHLQRGAAERSALAGDRNARTRDAQHAGRETAGASANAGTGPHLRDRRRAARRHDRRRHPGSFRNRPVVFAGDAGDRGDRKRNRGPRSADRGPRAPMEAQRILRRADRRSWPERPSAMSARSASGTASVRSTSASTPARRSSKRRRRISIRPTSGRTKRIRRTAAK